MHQVSTATSTSSIAAMPRKRGRPRKTSNEGTQLPIARKVASPSPKPRRIGLREAGRMIGISRSSIYLLIGRGEIVPVHLAGRTLVRVSDLERLAGDASSIT